MTAIATEPAVSTSESVSPTVSPTVSAAGVSDEEFARAWHEWHAKRDRILSGPREMLALVSLDWLEDGVDTHLDTFPGTFRLDGDTFTYTPEPGKVIRVHGINIVGPRSYIVPGQEDANVARLNYGDKQAEVIKRLGGQRQYAVRVRDPKSPLIVNFRGTPYFEPNRAWVVPASYRPYESLREETVDASLDFLKHIEQAVGELTVTIDGHDYTLQVFQGHDDGHGTVLFRDGTSGKETYGGARVLGLNIKDPASVTEVDFNRATNLPCAYSPYCTCPLAPLSNTLPVRVTAGEKLPYEHR